MTIIPQLALMAMTITGGDDVTTLPATAEQVDNYGQYTVYLNIDSPSANEGDTPEVDSVWLTDETDGTVRRICVTNPYAEPLWQQMKGKDPDAADTDLEHIAAAERAWIAPCQPLKIIVEGCPDGRNYWTYIINIETMTAKQYPSTEGVQFIDYDQCEITLASYGYDDDGRYSYQQVYSTDGKFLRRTGEIERE